MGVDGVHWGKEQARQLNFSSMPSVYDPVLCCDSSRRSSQHYRRIIRASPSHRKPVETSDAYTDSTSILSSLSTACHVTFVLPYTCSCPRRAFKTTSWPSRRGGHSTTAVPTMLSAPSSRGKHGEATRTDLDIQPHGQMLESALFIIGQLELFN